MGATPQQGIKLRVVYGQELGNLDRDIQKAIAYRAYDLYAGRGRSHGHDLEDWFLAEHDLIKPGNVQITEAGDKFVVRAEVPGFDADEIRIGVAPRKVVIWGQAAGSPSASSQYQQQMLGEVDLPSPVSPEGAGARLRGGEVEITAPKERA
jgi:HSP20 family protein